jgi:hypothetical protein
VVEESVGCALGLEVVLRVSERFLSGGLHAAVDLCFSSAFLET